MLMDEGSALFGVAGVAGVVDAVALEQFRAGRAVRIMAIRADHLAFRHGVMRRTVHLGALLLVAGVADFGLGSALAYLVVVVVDLVAGAAGNIGSVMLAA